MILQGRSIFAGVAEGEALVTRMGISFYGGVDPETGVVVERSHELEGRTIAGKILVFPTGKGSTVGSYTLYRLRHAGLAPLAIVECRVRADYCGGLHHRRDPLRGSHPARVAGERTDVACRRWDRSRRAAGL